MKAKIKVRQVREALARIASDFEKPWPKKNDLKKYIRFLEQTTEVLKALATKTQFDDDTVVEYEAPPGAPVGRIQDRPKPPKPDCDELVTLYVQ